MGLADTERVEGLKKVAAESDVGKKIDSLIAKQAYEDISEKFKSLGPLILGINIVERVSENVILAAAKLAIPDKNIMIPIVYTNGKIESTLFIYNEDTDVLLGMTKKIIGIITTDSGSIDGSAVTNGGVDNGSIHKLFVPPRTFSPKVASGSLLVRMMETNDLLKEAVHKKAMVDWDFRAELENTYGSDILKLAQSGVDNARLSQLNHDASEPETLWSRKEIFDSTWIEKRAAIKEFSVNGFAISEGKNTPSLSLTPVGTVKEKIMGRTDSNEIESFTVNSNGAFLLYTNDGEEIEVFSAPLTTGFNGHKTFGDSVNTIASDKHLSLTPDDAYVATKIPLSYAKTLKNFSKSLFEVSKKDERGYPEYSTGNCLVILKGDSVAHSFPLGGIRRGDIAETLGTFTVRGSYANPTVVIEKGSSKAPVLVEKTVHVGERNVKVVTRGTLSRPDVIYPLKLSSLNKSASENEIISATHDGVNFIYKQASYNKKMLVSQLLNEGYDKFSIYNLVKTAESKGGVSLEAINAKIEMLSTMMMNLAGSRASLPPEGLSGIPAPAPAPAPAPGGLSAIPAPAPEVAQQPMSPVEGMSSPMQGMAPLEGEGQQQPMPPEQYMGQQQPMPPEQYMGQQQPMSPEQDMGQQQPMPPEQDMGQQQPMPPEQDMGQQQPMPSAEGMSSPMQGMAPMEGMPPMEQGEEQEVLQDGMNTSLDADTIRLLSELKDSSVMDMGILASVGATSELGETIVQYRDDIQLGVSATGRILLNLMTKKESIEDSIGASKYKQLVGTLKPIFLKMSDLYADIFYLKLESGV